MEKPFGKQLLDKEKDNQSGSHGQMAVCLFWPQAVDKTAKLPGTSL